jgi:phosphogluconate 2-dehydrogenase
MNKRVIVAYGRPLSESLLKLLRQDFEVVSVRHAKNQGKVAFGKAITRANGLIGAGITLGPELLDQAEHLEIISNISDGFDNYDLDYLTKRGVLLTNTPDVETETVADAGFALLLATARRIVELAQSVKNGRWSDGTDSSVFGIDIHGKCLGMVGFGRIGQAIARRGHFGFGMSIVYWDRVQKEEATALGARFSRLDELLADSDFICVTLPLSAETEHLLGTSEFALMRTEAIFINISRGHVVDEKALIDALQHKRLWGAGLDVFETEPLPVDSPLLKMPNVLATPHIGAATLETFQAMDELAVQNLLTGLHGERPANLVNPDVWGKQRTLSRMQNSCA